MEKNNSTETVEPRWRRSSKCDHGQCVEIADMSGAALMRDSTNPEGGQLRFDREAWNGFLGGVATGIFDRPALAEQAAA